MIRSSTPGVRVADEVAAGTGQEVLDHDTVRIDIATGSGDGEIEVPVGVDRLDHCAGIEQDELSVDAD